MSPKELVPIKGHKYVCRYVSIFGGKHQVHVRGQASACRGGSIHTLEKRL